MLRSFINLRIGQPIIKQSIGFRFLTTKQLDEQAKARKKIESKLKQAKNQLKNTNTKVKALETKHKQLGKDRQRQAQIKEKKQLQKEKEYIKKQQLAKDKLIEKATAAQRAVNLRGFIAMTQKIPVTELSTYIEKLSSDELDKYTQGREEYNIKKKSFFTEKPELPSVRPYNKYLSERFDEYKSNGLTNQEIFKEVGQEWKNLAVDEKAKYDIPEGNLEEKKRLLKEWQQKELENMRNF